MKKYIYILLFFFKLSKQQGIDVTAIEMTKWTDLCQDLARPSVL